MTQISSVPKSFLLSSGFVRSAALLCACTVLHCGIQAPPEPSAGTEPPAQLALSPSNPQMAQGTAQQFDVQGLFADGRTRDLTEQVKWTVADDRGLTSAMPADGYLQLERPGRYVVTADYQGRALTTTLFVTAATVKSIAISPRTPKVAKGLTQAFTTVATFSDGTTQDVTKLATWAVKDVLGTGVATIDTLGVLVAKNVGKATITTRYQSYSSWTTMEVTAAKMTALLVSPADPTIASGTNQRFVATGVYSDGSAADVTPEVTWAVTDLTGTGVAAIDGTGVANGKSVGRAQISADYDGLTGQTTLIVSPAVPAAVAISPASSAIAKGTTQRYTATATLTDGTTQDVTALAAWTATDKTGTGVASVDKTGLAKGNTEGSATISCVLLGHAASALLTVTPAVLTGVVVNPAAASVGKGQYRTLSAVGSYSDGSTQDVTATAVWTATDLSGTDIASVATGGRVLGKNLGQATITASVGAFAGSAVVTVTPVMYTGLSVTPSSTATFVGFSVQLSAIAKQTDGTTKDVSNLVTWTVTDILGNTIDTLGSSTLATVSSTGLVKTFARGVVLITATLGGFSASSQLFIIG